MKRGYYVGVESQDYGVAVVATNAREAKKIAWGHDLLADCEWIDVTVTWQKKAKVEDLPIGEVKDLMLALKRNIFDSVGCEDCQTCDNKDTKVYNVNGKIECLDCEESHNSTNASGGKK